MKSYFIMIILSMSSQKRRNFSELVYQVLENFPIMCLVLFCNCSAKWVFFSRITDIKKCSENQSRKNWESLKKNATRKFFSDMNMIEFDKCLGRTSSWLCLLLYVKEVFGEVFREFKMEFYSIYSLALINVHIIQEEASRDCYQLPTFRLSLSRSRLKIYYGKPTFG